VIFGDRIRLRAPEREDLPRFVAWLNDPQVRVGLKIYLPLSQVMEEDWFENMLKRPAEEHPLVIEIHQDDTWIPVGNCGFIDINWRLRSAQVGIFIGEKSYWNQGYGTEVMQLLLNHGFNTLNLNRIGLMVYEDNRRAIRSYEKAGFTNEGRFRQGHYQNGDYIDVILMSVLREEWVD
jgi:RimJ/RimL family protein N-acetyltransferase